MTKPVALAQFEGDWSDLAGTDMKTPLAKPVAPEVDLDQWEVRTRLVLGSGNPVTHVPCEDLLALIAENRALRAITQPHVGSCVGCFFAEVELLAALKDGAEAGEPAEKLLRRVLDVLRDEAHRPACATKLPPVGVGTTWQEAWKKENPNWADQADKPQGRYIYALSYVDGREMFESGWDARGAAAKPPAGVEVTDALAALDKLVSDHCRNETWDSGGRELVDTIRSALEKCR